MGEKAQQGERKSCSTDLLFVCQFCICSKFLGVFFTTPKSRKTEISEEMQFLHIWWILIVPKSDFTEDSGWDVYVS